MILRVWVCLASVLPSWQVEGGISDEFLIEELPGQSSQNEFRPITAREAMKHAGRIAQKQRSDEDGTKYALLRGAGIGPKGIRVAVHTVVEVTTSRYNFQRPGFRKAPAWPDSRQRLHDDISSPSQSQWKPHEHQAFTRNPQNHNQRRVEQQKPKKIVENHVKKKPWERKKSRDHRRDFRNLKRNRDKRQVGSTYTGGGFDLPPMSNEWNIKKKKKKRKKKITTTNVPKQMQKKSKKFRIYMESSEVKLTKGKAKGKVMDVVRGLSKELEQLLAEANEAGEENSPQSTAAPVTKAKFVPIPKNWQNPPSWRPPTRGPLGMLRHAPRGRWKPVEAVTSPVPPQITEPVTEFDWKSYDHPYRTSKAELIDSLVLKPAPEDWPQPTHPADGLYDWHKSQLRMAPRTPPPMPTHSVASLSDGPYNRYNYRGGPRFSRHYVRYTAAPTTSWSWAKPAEDQRIMYRNNHMWQTRAWIPRVQPAPASTWPTIGPKRDFSDFQWDSPAEEVQTELDINQLYSRQTRNGKPHAGWNPSLSERGRGEAYNQQRFSYRYGSQHASAQGVRSQGEGVSFQYHRHQDSYQNYTNYYNQYYQQYYSHSDNKSTFHHSLHNEDKQAGRGYYQTNNFYQNQAQQQSRMKPPSYFFNALEELKPSKDLEESSNHTTENMEAPYRYHDEYAGNDRDLRAPLPTPFGNHPLPSRGRWTPARFRPAVRRKHQGWARRAPGVRPSGFRSIFTAPLQRLPWNSTLSDRISVANGITPRIL